MEGEYLSLENEINKSKIGDYTADRVCPSSPLAPLSCIRHRPNTLMCFIFLQCVGRGFLLADHQSLSVGLRKTWFRRSLEIRVCFEIAGCNTHTYMYSVNKHDVKWQMSGTNNAKHDTLMYYVSYEAYTVCFCTIILKV